MVVARAFVATFAHLLIRLVGLDGLLGLVWRLNLHRSQLLLKIGRAAVLLLLAISGALRLLLQRSGRLAAPGRQ